MIEKTVRRFPDGETYIRMEGGDFKDEDVFVIHSLYPEQNDNLFELFLTMVIIKEGGGKPCLVIPYFAYGRQDRAFQPGEAFSLKTIGKIMHSLGAKKLITVDAHFHRKIGDFDFFGVPARNISAVTVQTEHAKETIGEEFTVVGPDEGSRNFLSGIEGAVFLKKEKRCPVCGMEATECRCKNPEKEYAVKTDVPEKLEGRNVLLLDDIIGTGSTIIEAAKALRSKNNRVFVGCTHGLFLGDSLKSLSRHAEYVFSTDTVKSEATKISVAGMLSVEMKKGLG